MAEIGYTLKPTCFMNHRKLALVLWIVLLVSRNGYGQKLDTTKAPTVFSGKLGLTTNGFSIIPTFSLNSPAFITLLSWRKKRFSIDPDIRMTPNLKRGGIVLWFRYYPVERPKFTLRVGAHPALNIQQRTIVDNGDTSKISQMRRFLAWEVSPSFRLSKNFYVSLYYLQGNGLQKDGPQTTHFVNLNAAIANIRLANRIRLAIFPAVYYLYLDGNDGWYFTENIILSHTKFPFSLESAINQTFTSNIPGNRNFMWNVSINYNFRKVLGRVH
jgi:hypothetical protein